MLKKPPYFAHREHYRQLRSPLRPDRGIETAHIFMQYLAKQKKEGVKGLILRG